MSFRSDAEMKADEKAYYLLYRIRNDLNPYGFTVEEIFEEGIDGVLYSRHSSSHENNEGFRKRRIYRALKRLMDKELIEKDDEACDTLFVTEAGMEMSIDYFEY